MWSSLVRCVLQIADAVYTMPFLHNCIIQEIILFQLDITKQESYLKHSRFQTRWQLVIFRRSHYEHDQIDFVIKHKCINEFSTRIDNYCASVTLNTQISYEDIVTGELVFFFFLVR